MEIYDQLDKDHRADAKLIGLAERDEDAYQTLWRFRNPEEDGEKLTYAVILLMLPERFGISSSLPGLHKFYCWQRLDHRMREARAAANQAREMRAADPTATAESIANVGQLVFTSEMVAAGNVKLFVELEKLRALNRQIDMDLEKLALLKAKAALADSAKQVLTTTLSPEEQNRRLREILK